MKDKNELLRNLLTFEEGVNTEVHLVKKQRHIGIGHLLEAEQTPEECVAMGVPEGWHIDDQKDGKFSLTNNQVNDLFDVDVDDAIHDVHPSFTDEELDALGETRRAVILSMVFQMGGAGLRKFPGCIKAVKAGDFERASLEMLYGNVELERESAWHKETPDRCDRAARAMRFNSFAMFEEIDAEDAVVKEQGKSRARAYVAEDLVDMFISELKKSGLI